MGAGQSHAGLRLQQVAIPDYPTALQFDPNKRRYIQNADGTMAELDTVDASVTLLLGIEYGSIGTAPTFGQKLRAVLNRVSPARQQTIAFQEVARVLSAHITAGDIALLSVTVQPSNSLGQLAVFVKYQNLRASGQPVRPPVPIS
jgi:hypothetical protein